MDVSKNIDRWIVLFLMLVGLSGCTLDRIAARQAQATGLWAELHGVESFGQSFVSGSDNLYRIDLSTATFDRINSAPVNFYLKENPIAATVLYSVTLPGPEIQNQRPTSLVFPMITNSKDKSYYFYIESPEAMPGNAITIYVNEGDQYPDGSAYHNDRVVRGDLTFSAYSRQTFTINDILGGLISRAAQDMTFFIFYTILILSVCVGLFLSVRRGD